MASDSDVRTSMDKIKGGTYLIINKINGNHYVGSTNDLRKRFNHHKHKLRKDKHSNQSLQKDWNEYKEEQFAFVVIHRTDDKDIWLQIEQTWLDSNLADFNISPTATSCAGVTRSIQTRAKMSLSFKDPKRIELLLKMAKKPKTDEHKSKISASHMGKTVSQETKDKMKISSEIRWSKEENILASVAAKWVYCRWFFVHNINTKEDFIFKGLAPIVELFGGTEAHWCACSKQGKVVYKKYKIYTLPECPKQRAKLYCSDGIIHSSISTEI